VAGKRRPPAQARAETVPLPAGRAGTPPPVLLARLLPSSRSLLLGLLLLGLGLGGYLLARETSLFAVQRIEVEGGSPALRERVRRALAPLLGSSLVSFSPAQADRRLAAIAELAAVRYDRDFPHTLRVTVRAERPLALLRRGAQAWLASAGGRVLRPQLRPYPPLPRVWLPPAADPIVGEPLAGAAATALRVLALLHRRGPRLPVRAVRATEAELTLVLASGLEVRLGDAADLALKLSVAGRILPLAAGARYVDVSVPERAVAGYGQAPAPPPNPQVEG
jgi:cell division protein FtsQ